MLHVQHRLVRGPARRRADDFDGHAAAHGHGHALVLAAQSIAAGAYHQCALTADGTAWCSGDQWYGVLGNPNANGQSPAPVSNLTNITALAGGYVHTCALLADGTVWCWGSNWYDQLGNDTTLQSTVPMQVSGLSDVTAIAAGFYHTCALKSDGTVWCRALTDVGQLGNGIGSNGSGSLPVQVSDLTGVTAITAEGWHTCAVKSDGTIWCWGDNSDGQLGGTGYGTCDGAACSSVPVQVPDLSDVTLVVAGGFHTCAIESDTTVWCRATTTMVSLVTVP